MSIGTSDTKTITSTQNTTAVLVTVKDGAIQTVTIIPAGVLANAINISNPSVALDIRNALDELVTYLQSQGMM